jgi:hypothetical protein
MDIVILAIIVCIVAFLALYLVDTIVTDSRLNLLLHIAIIVVAILIIVSRSGIIQ